MMIPHDPLRRVAILVATLDTQSADLLLEQLSPEDATHVRRMMVDLDDVDAGEEQSVIGDFLRTEHAGVDLPSVPSPDDGVELCISANLPTPGATSDAIPIAPVELAPPDDGLLFGFLEDAEPERLVKLLATERSQTIALVISRLSGSRALEVLGSLPARLQCEVIRRWIDLDGADPAVLREIEQELQAKIATRIECPARRATGLAQVAGMVQAADAHLKKQILANLAEHDGSLAHKITAPRLAFEDLEYLNDVGLASLVRAADPTTTVLALADASETFVERVMRQLPAVEAKRLRRAIESLGPTRLTDLERAQQDLAALAETIVARSTVTLSSLPLTAAG
jgi:flagellar motor switch protein FliG